MSSVSVQKIMHLCVQIGKIRLERGDKLTDRDAAFLVGVGYTLQRRDCIGFHEKCRRDSAWYRMTLPLVLVEYLERKDTKAALDLIKRCPDVLAEWTRVNTDDPVGEMFARIFRNERFWRCIGRVLVPMLSQKEVVAVVRGVVKESGWNGCEVVLGFLTGVSGENRDTLLELFTGVCKRGGVLREEKGKTSIRQGHQFQSGLICGMLSAKDTDSLFFGETLTAFVRSVNLHITATGGCTQLPLTILILASELENASYSASIDKILLSISTKSSLKAPDRGFSQPFLKRSLQLLQHLLHQQPSQSVFNKTLQFSKHGTQQAYNWRRIQAMGGRANKTTRIHLLRGAFTNDSPDLATQHDKNKPPPYKEILKLITKHVDPTIHTLTTLIKGFSSPLQKPLNNTLPTETSLQIFTKLLPRYTLVPDTHAYATLIHALTLNGQYESAIEFIKEMKNSGAVVGKWVLNPLLRCVLREEDDGYAVMRQVEEFVDGMHPLYSNPVERFAKYTAQVSEEERVPFKLTSDDLPLITILFQHNVHAKNDQALQILMDLVEASGVTIDAYLYTSWASFYLQKGDAQSALNLLTRIQFNPNQEDPQSILFDIPLYTLKVRALMNLGMEKEAFQVCLEMHHERVFPDYFFYKALVSLMRENCSEGYTPNQPRGDVTPYDFGVLVDKVVWYGGVEGVGHVVRKWRDVYGNVDGDVLRFCFEEAVKDGKEVCGYILGCMVDQKERLGEEDITRCFGVLGEVKEGRGSIQVLESIDRLNRSSLCAAKSVSDVLYVFVEDCKTGNGGPVTRKRVELVKHVPGIYDADLPALGKREKLLGMWIMIVDSLVLRGSLTSSTTHQVLDTLHTSKDPTVACAMWEKSEYYSILMTQALLDAFERIFRECGEDGYVERVEKFRVRMGGW